MKSRLLRHLADGIISEAPPHTPAELEHLATPTTPEAADLLRLLPILDLIPLDENTRLFLPAFRRVLEDAALNCDRGQQFGVDARTRAASFMSALRAAVLPAPPA